MLAHPGRRAAPEAGPIASGPARAAASPKTRHSPSKRPHAGRAPPVSQSIYDFIVLSLVSYTLMGPGLKLGGGSRPWGRRGVR